MDLNGFTDSENVFLDRAYLECEEMFVEADALIKAEKITEAVERLNKIIGRNPQFGKAYNHLGWIYENKYKNFPKAEECYKKAFQYAPDYAATYLNYIYLLSNLARLDELKAHLDRIAQTPTLAIAKETLFNEYAVLYEMRGEPQEALDYYFKAAMVTLDSFKLEKYQEAIERCKKKLNLKNMLAESESSRVF